MPLSPGDRDEMGRLRGELDRLSAELKAIATRLQRLEHLESPPAARSTYSAQPAPPLVEPIAIELIAEPPRVSSHTAPLAAAPPRMETSPFAAATPPRPRTAASAGDGVPWEAWIGTKGLTWLGAIVLIVALGFTVHWAATTFETPPELQVLGLHLLSAGILAAGYLAQRRKLPILAQGLTGLGIFALYATAFATLLHYKLGNQYTAFAEGAAITVLAIVLAVRADSPAVVLLGALGGFLTPALTSTGSQRYVELFTYLALLNVALCACAVWKGWSFLKPLALAATAVMFFGWFNDEPYLASRGPWPTEWFLVVHALIFLAASTIPPWFWKQTSLATDLVALSGSSLGFMGATWRLFHEDTDQQLALVSWGLAVLHLALFAVTYARVTNVDRMPRLQLALAAVFVTLAAPLEIDDYRYLATSWCVEGVVFTAVGVYFRDRQMQATALAIFAVALVRLVGWDYFSRAEFIPGTPIDLRFALVLAAGLLMMAAGSLYWAIPLGLGVSPRETGFGPVGGGSLLATGNLTALAALPCQWDSRLVLVLWTLDAAAIWIAGFWLAKPAARWYALYVAVLLCGGAALYYGSRATEPFVLLANDRFGTLVLLGAVYFVAAWFYRGLCRASQASPAEPYPPQRMQTASPLGEHWVDSVLAVLANLVLVAAVSLEIGSYFDQRELAMLGPLANNYMVRMATFSVVWAIYAAVLVAAGFLLRWALLRYLGLAGFLIVLGKVFLVDLAEIELLPRVLAFTVLGLALLGVSFMYQRYTARLREP